MAKKGRHRKGGRVTPKGTRPEAYRSHYPGDVGGHAPEPDLIGDVRRAVADEHPRGLLTLVSSLLAVVDPRRVSPFERSSQEPVGPSREELLRTFTEVDQPETSALLAAVAALGADQVEQRRIARILEARDHRLPAWLAGMGAAKAYRAVEMIHVLRDGDNVMVGVRFPTGHELTAVVYIDHNLGTLVKDAFVVPEPMGELLEFMRAEADDPDTTFADIRVADAKARIVDAIETGAISFPPFETDTWPLCRPLVEWMVGLLPDGGCGYERPEWSDEDRRDLTERFFSSSFGAKLDDRDHRGLLDSILWFGSDYGPGDPLRWSPVAVEILLDDWIPRKIVADVDYLAKAPELLRGFVRFCHAERAIPSHLTNQTLDAVDRWEPDYQATIRSPRLQGPAALLAAVGALDADGPLDMSGDDDEDDDPWDYETLMLGLLERAVGGALALDALDATPLPDEPFDWTGIPGDVHDRVGEVLALCDRCCDEMLDVEYRTAVRRVLARIAVNGPEAFRRRGRADTAAAAICWAVCRANDAFGQRSGGFTQKALLAHFGLQNGSVSQRAATLLDAGGFPHHRNDFALGSPDYLTSARRRDILDKRARFSDHERRETILRRMGEEGEDLGLEY